MSITVVTSEKLSGGVYFKLKSDKVSKINNVSFKTYLQHPNPMPIRSEKEDALTTKKLPILAQTSITLFSWLYHLSRQRNFFTASIFRKFDVKRKSFFFFQTLIPASLRKRSAFSNETSSNF